MSEEANAYEVVLTWREGGERREARGDVLGRSSGVDAAQHLVDLTFADALTRARVKEDGHEGVFAVDRGRDRFDVEAAWRRRG